MTGSRLLRQRPKQPRRRAAEPSDEFAPSQIPCVMLANLGKLYHGDVLRVIRTDDWLDDSVRELTP
jgi:hypothetical protein